MMGTILNLYHNGQKAVAVGIPISQIMQTGLFEKVIKIKYDIPNENLAMFDDYNNEINQLFQKLLEQQS